MQTPIARYYEELFFKQTRDKYLSPLCHYSDDELLEEDSAEDASLEADEAVSELDEDDDSLEEEATEEDELDWLDSELDDELTELDEDDD